MGFIKFAVVAMAVLIVAGLVGLVVAIGTRMGNDDGVQPASFTLPPDAEVAETRLDGDRLVIRLTLADGASRILLIDLRTGKQAGVIDLRTTR